MRPASSRIKHFNAAIESLSIGVGGNGDTSIKTLLILFFKLAIVVLEKDSREIEDALSKIQKFLDGPHTCGLKPFYTRNLNGIAISRDFASVEELLEATPYL